VWGWKMEGGKRCSQMSLNVVQEMFSEEQLLDERLFPIIVIVMRDTADKTSMS
jgi:hypothetical protein